LIHKRGNGQSRPTAGTNNRDAIVQAIRRSFGRNQAILAFADDAGIRLAVRPKESRERLSKRLADVILIQPEPKRRQIMEKLDRSDAQTQGWIDVIKSDRP
jgi:hypothetical protein